MRIRKVLFWIILLLLAATELLLSWRVPGFSDFYVKHVFPIFQETFGRIGGLFSFSLGEILIYIAALYVLLSVVIWVVRFFLFFSRKKHLKKLARGNFKVFVKILILVALIMVQNCFVLYHTTPILSTGSYAEYEASREDLIDLYEKLVSRANELSTDFERDKKGYVIYDGDLAGISVISMQGIGEKAAEKIKAGEGDELDEKLKLLSGYYSLPKPFLKSDFFSQQYIKGYYFPFSLEANYNELMYPVNFPETMCHELSHLKGFIFEDEANFLSYLGCMSSGNKFFEYSAIVDALSYVMKDVKRELALEPDRRDELSKPNDLVIADSIFLTEEAWDEVESDAWLDTEVVSGASNTFLDTNLTMNGVSDGVISYSRMVNLLLKYYYGGEVNG